MKKNLLEYNHNACVGCGQVIAARTAVNALGPETIITNATGCLEVTTTLYPNTSWKLPWIHSVFANAPAVASGIIAALKQRGDTKTRVAVLAGDGATFDIGFGALSGMWSRDEDIIYICFDNEIYANTGMQASAATPNLAHTSTSPSGTASWGKTGQKKDMLAIALAHGLSYVAQTTAGFVDDIQKKITKAKKTKGPSYIQILSPCVPGWSVKPQDVISIGKLAAYTGLYPSVEYQGGKLTDRIMTPKPRPKVDNYLEKQTRFKHLFKSKIGKNKIKELQKIADNNIRNLKL